MRVKSPKPSFWKNLIVRFREVPVSTLCWYAGGGVVGLILTGLLTFQITQYKLRTSEFNRLVLEKLAEHPKVIDLLGEPVQAGNVYSRKRGSILENQVDCIVPVQGRYTDGLIKYQADKLEGSWVIRKMEFTFLDEAGGVLRLVKDEESKTDVEPKITHNTSKI